MPNLKTALQNDLICAMKEKDTVKTSAIRMLKAAMMKWEVAGTAKKEATDEVMVDLVGKEIKQRKDSIEQFRKGGREDLAVKEEAEIKVLEKYLPEQMSENEVQSIVQAAVTEISAQGKADMGRVMGIVMPKVKGKADGTLVRRMVEEAMK